MKPLGVDFNTDHTLIDAKLSGLAFEARQKLDQDKIRDEVEDYGLKYWKYSPENASSMILCGDCSISVRPLRYNALWATHAVCISALFDGKTHDDRFVGHGSVAYDHIKYSSHVDVGEFIPYSDLDSRGNSLRVAYESGCLTKSKLELDEEGFSPDMTLLDGSIYTNQINLEGKDNTYDEHTSAISQFSHLLSSGKVVGLVEDSHATDLSRMLGYNVTNMLIMDVSLYPGEYLVDERGDVKICYLKLPPKTLSSSVAGSTKPLTVRWEFNYEGFHSDLCRLVGMWLMEDDLLHPQLYPVRLADYLTRKIKVNSLLDAVVERNEMPLKHRMLRGN